MNPFAIVSRAIQQTLTMPAEKRRRRMNWMRSQVAVNNIYRWAAKIMVSQTAGIESPEASRKREMATAEV